LSTYPLTQRGFFMPQIVKAYDYDIEAISEYHDKLKADNQRFMEVLVEIAHYQCKQNYSMHINRIKKLAEDAIK